MIMYKYNKLAMVCPFDFESCDHTPGTNFGIHDTSFMNLSQTGLLIASMKGQQKKQNESYLSSNLSSKH